MSTPDAVTVLNEAERKARRPSKEKVYGMIEDLLNRSGISLEEIQDAQVEKLKIYEGFYKTSEGGAEKVDMLSFQLNPKWQTGPAWPVVQPGPPIKVNLSTSLKKVQRTRKTLRDGWERAVVVPDIQGGYFHNAEGDLEAIHDEAALELLLQAVADIQPDLIVMVGDNLDLAEFSRYRMTDAFARTTQATVDWGTLFCARLRTAAPLARIVWLAGNHEERLPNYILDNGRSAFAIRQGGNPDGWPVMSVPHLLRLDESEVEYLPGYPASHFWINERLRVIHGNRVKSNGSTAHLYLDNEKTSVIYGHIHRREWAERTRMDYDGAKTIMAASPGCLARTDGVVPSTKGGNDLFGRPLRIQEDWQQGFGVVTYEPGDGRFVYEQVAIHDAWCQYRGVDYSAKAA